VNDNDFQDFILMYLQNKRKETRKKSEQSWPWST